MVSFGLSLVTELGKQEHRNLAQWHERPSISRPPQQARRYATAGAARPRRPVPSSSPTTSATSATTGTAHGRASPGTTSLRRRRQWCPLPGVPLLREERNGSSQIGLHGGASRGSTGQYSSLSDHGRNNILAAVGIAATRKRTSDVVVRV